jgi:non-heme chloroperoxidase
VHQPEQGVSGTDFTEDLKMIDVPTLAIHGEGDRIVPVADSAKKSAKLIKHAKEIHLQTQWTVSWTD